MTTAQFAPAVREVVEAIGIPFELWAKQCHKISLAMVKAGCVPKGSRVARGSCGGVGGQHSWIAVQTDGSGELVDPYADPLIVDPTLWSYREEIEGIWVGRASEAPVRTKPGTPTLMHIPHGQGPHIMSAGRPDHPVGEVVELTHAARQELSAEALWWLEMIGPLDRIGWNQLAQMTVTGWPAGEIVRAMVATPQLKTLVPIDRVGMLTDLNPEGLYF